VEVFTTPEDFQAVRESLQGQGLAVDSAELAMIPKSLAQLGEKETFQAMNLVDSLEELDDVQQVYSNLDITDEIMAKYEAAA
jgi:transcriptional/translational regulatory protein YebC/TACO1